MSDQTPTKEEYDALTPREHTVLTALERAYARGERDAQSGNAGHTRPGLREARVVTAQITAAKHIEEEVQPLDDVKIMYEGLQAVSAEEWQPAGDVTLGQVLEAIARAWVKVSPNAPEV